MPWWKKFSSSKLQSDSTSVDLFQTHKIISLWNFSKKGLFPHEMSYHFTMDSQKYTPLKTLLDLARPARGKVEAKF